ncbi:MAG: hypothetical protein WCS03_10775 [Bacteroidota bacterium]
MKKILLVFIISCVFLSCEKDKQLIIENTDIPLISKVLIGGEIYMEYSYNSANLPSEEKSKFHYSKHNYNDRNQLITSDFYWDISMASSDSRVIEAAMKRTEWVNPDNTPKSISHSLEYNSNCQLIRKSYIRPSVNITNFVEFLYENDRVVRATGYYNNSISGYTDYKYDENGNITRQSKYFVSSTGIAELSTTTEYEYDNMNNPYQSFKRLMTLGIYTNKNNVTNKTYTLQFEVDPSIEKVQITENIYEYNDKGYPIKVNGLTEYVYK